MDSKEELKRNIFLFRLIPSRFLPSFAVLSLLSLPLFLLRDLAPSYGGKVGNKMWFEEQKKTRCSRGMKVRSEREKIHEK